MTVDTTEPVYHAGDLIGYNRAGQPLYLPGGGAEIVVDDGDDDPDVFDQSDDDDPDEPDDEPDEPDEPPQQQRKKNKPTYRDLLAEVAKLREGNTRNNRELMNRRHLAEFMNTHKIENLDQWLEELGVDRETGQLRGGTGNGSPAATEPPADPTGARDQGAPADAGPKPPEAVAVTEEEIARRVRLELAKQAAKDNPSPPDEPQTPDRVQVLETKAKLREVRLALREAGFNGKFDVAQRVLNMAGVQIDENGEVSGAEAAVQELREEIPEWFRRAGARTPPPPRGGESVDGGDKKPPTGKQPGWEEKVLSNWQRGK